MIRFIPIKFGLVLSYVGSDLMIVNMAPDNSTGIELERDRILELIYISHLPSIAWTGELICSIEVVFLTIHEKW